MFVNNSLATLQIAIFIREGSNPANQDGSQSFILLPEESLLVQYGTDTNVFLNGFVLFTILNGDLYSKVQFTTLTDSELDVLLNTNDTVTFNKIDTDYVVSGSGAPIL